MHNTLLIMGLVWALIAFTSLTLVVMVLGAGIGLTAKAIESL